MTRVIAGSVGGRSLRTPPGSGTRPTSDRVREALFSSLESALGGWSGVRVLDLYAGSGALGLEALSRGAAHALLVERDRRAAGVAAANARSLGLEGAQVRTAAVSAVLAGPADTAYDLVLADPPYPLDEAAVGRVLATLAAGWLADDAVVVVERSSRSPVPTLPGGLRLERSRRYGETVLHHLLWYGRPADEAP